MAVILVVAAITGISLAGSGYWTLWQSQNAIDEGTLPPALIALDRKSVV